MKRLILIIAAAINLSCMEPQKFNANLTITNSDAFQQNQAVYPTPTDALIFVISTNKEVFLQKKEKTELLGTIPERKKLEQKFFDLLKGKKDKTVFLKVPRAIKYGETETVLDALKLSGASPIGLQIEE